MKKKKTQDIFTNFGYVSFPYWDSDHSKLKFVAPAPFDLQ